MTNDVSFFGFHLTAFDAFVICFAVVMVVKAIFLHGDLTLNSPVLCKNITITHEGFGVILGVLFMIRVMDHENPKGSSDS